MKIMVSREDPNIPLPLYQTEGAVGMDIHAAETIFLPCYQVSLIKTGLRVALPPGWEFQVRSRSGLAARHGIMVLNSPGTVDPDYRGELKVILANLGTTGVLVERGHRIAQLVLAPMAPRVEWEEVNELPPTERGEGGLGSTGR